MRITNKDLEALCDRLNEITGNPAKPYVDRKAQIGNFNISGAYGGVCLHQIMNEGGGVRCPLDNYHAPKRELYQKMQAFISGLEWEQR